jgi:hypothetical protein
MPLEPQSQKVAIGAVGMDQSDGSEGQPSGLDTLLNRLWNKDSVLSRRHGFTRQVAVSDPLGLVQSGNVLGVVTSTSVRPLPASAGGRALSATRTDFQPHVVHETVTTLWEGARVQQADIAYMTVSGVALACVGWTEWDATLATGTAVAKIAVLEVATGAVVYRADVGAQMCRVLAVANSSAFVALSWVGSGPSYQLKATAVSGFGSTIGSGQANVSVANAFDGATVYAGFDAICNDGTNIYSIHRDKTVDNMVLTKITVSGSTPVPTLLNGSINLHTGTMGLAITQLANGKLAVLSSDSAGYSTVYVFTTAGAGGSVTASDVFAAANAASYTLGQFGIVDDGTGANVYCFYDALQARTFISKVNTTTGAITGITISGYPNQKMMSRPWLRTQNGTTFLLAVVVPGNNQSTAYNQTPTGYGSPTLMAYDVTGATLPIPVAQLAFDEMPPADLFGSVLPANVPAETGTTYLFAIPADLETAVNPNGDQIIRRVRVSRLTFPTATSTTPWTAAQLGGTGFYAASLPQAFDGYCISSAAFLTAPAAPTVAAVASVQTLVAGTYTYRTLLEISDKHGNIQVSPPGLPVTITVPSGNHVLVTVPIQPIIWPRIPETDGNGTLRVKIYRTHVGGSTFQLLATSAPVTIGSSFSYADSLTDAQLGETLYTTGNVLESQPAPPLVHLCAHRDRLFGIQSDDPATIPFTQELAATEYPRWHSALSLRVDNDGGDPTAVASLDDKLVIFQANQVCVVAGDGPDGTGSGSFSTIEVVARGVGVGPADRASVVTTPMGVMFRHSTGVHLLGRDLSVQPVGRPVEDYLTGQTCVLARHMPSMHQVWLAVKGTTNILAFDTRYGRWAVYTMSGAGIVDMVEYAGTPYVLTSAYLYKYDTTTYKDDAGDATPLFVERMGIPWFRPARATSLRVWRVHLAGKVLGTDSTVTVRLYTQQEERVNRDDTAANNTLTWGPTVWSGEHVGSGFLVSGRAVTQRCQGFRVEIDIVPGSDNAGLTVSEMVIDFGVDAASRGKSPVGKRPSVV